MENILICKNCRHNEANKIGKHKNGAERTCCEKPEFITLEEYLLNSIYRPNDSEIELRSKIITIVYSKLDKTEMINKIKELL